MKNDSSNPQVQSARKPNEELPALECKNVGRTFMIGKGFLSSKKPLRAVDDVSLKINRGQVFAVVGESGCGKTTLARMLLGLLEPTEGAIYLDGQPIREVSSDMISRKVQPVFQDPYSSLNPRKTIESIISLPLRVHDIGTKENRLERVSELMRLVGLPNRLIHSYPNQLSGGQRQRVAIARALIMEPGIIVCDEPTSALDVSVQAVVLQLLDRLKREFGMSYIFVSHDLNVVRLLCERVIVMNRGQIVESGLAEDVLKRPTEPYTQNLINAIP